MQASNYCKRVFEAVKLAYANKTKDSITSETWLLGLGELIIAILMTQVSLNLFCFLELI